MLWRSDWKAWACHKAFEALGEKNDHPCCQSWSQDQRKLLWVEIIINIYLPWTPKGLWIIQAFWLVIASVSVKGDPGQEQVLTFLSNGIPFMTLTFSFHKLGVFFAVPHRFVTVVELEPPAWFGHDFNTFSDWHLASQMSRLHTVKWEDAQLVRDGGVNLLACPTIIKARKLLSACWQMPRNSLQSWMP